MFYREGVPSMDRRGCFTLMFERFALSPFSAKTVWFSCSVLFTYRTRCMFFNQMGIFLILWNDRFLKGTQKSSSLFQVCFVKNKSNMNVVELLLCNAAENRTYKGTKATTSLYRIVSCMCHSFPFLYFTQLLTSKMEQSIKLFCIKQWLFVSALHFGVFQLINLVYHLSTGWCAIFFLSIFFYPKIQFAKI